jgi:hypothetical protein
VSSILYILGVYPAVSVFFEVGYRRGMTGRDLVLVTGRDLTLAACLVASFFWQAVYVFLAGIL